MDEDSFEIQMRELRNEYLTALPGHVQDIQEAWQKANAGTWEGAQFCTLIRLAHNLAGSGATYGIVPVSQSARELELYAKGLDGSARPGEETRAEIDRLIENLRACVLVTS
jgi:HPt (histidine-containing phosphotransfer) domain-containing protein